MNTIETHAVITHISIVGSLLGLLILLYGLLAKSYYTQMTGYLTLAVASAVAIFAYISGNDLGYNMRGIQYVSQNNLAKHTDFANYSIILIFFLGMLSLLALWLNLKDSSLAKTVSHVVVATAIISFAVVARTGYLGTQIRHFEVRNKTLPEIPAAVNKVTVTSYSGK